MGRVVIVGGGISGLAVGYELLSKGLQPEELRILESDDRAGGNLRTVKKAGFTIEAGPNGFLDNSPATLALVERLGLTNRILKSNEWSAVRFIYSRNKLRKVPKGPLGMLTSGLLPIGGALRVFNEPFIKKGGYDDESVYDFAKRRIGTHAANILIDAMVSGVFAGDPKDLEMKAAFPKMVAMEQKYGGLVKALIAIKKEKRNAGGPSGPGGRLTSFTDGFDELPRALADQLKPCLTTKTAAKEIRHGEQGYIVITDKGENIQAESVVLACPGWVSKSIVAPMNPSLSQALSKIESSPIAVVATAYNNNELPKKLDGFGFLVPRNQGPRILGCLWTSSIWENRAPEGRTLLRTMIGGSQDEEALSLDDRELKTVVSDDLKKIMDIHIKPLYSQIFRYKMGIARYRPGHTQLLTTLEEMLQKQPGLFISGSSYRGISVNHCIDEAPKIADQVISSQKPMV